ncbi:MAG: hypothetical protein HZA51_03985 [Planctomycetes bacterium]|nr:hypothetical protein [Planctomycetota bacterium]
MAKNLHGVRGVLPILAVGVLVVGVLRPDQLAAQCTTISGATNVDISKRVGNEAETNIAIDPTNPLRLFAMAVPASGSSQFGAYSTDGGVNWTSRLFLTGADGMSASCCDGQLAWDNFGNLFVTYINSAGTAVIVGMSTNGGVSFSQIGSFAGGVDQPSIAVGPGSGGVNGSVWVDYNISGTMRVRGASVTGLGAVGAFSAEVSPPTASGTYGGIAVGPLGQVMITYQGASGGQGPTTIYCNTDPDGLGGSGFGARVTITNTNVGGFDFIPAQNGRSIDAEAGLAWDRTGGAHHGRVYLVYTEETVNENNDTEIYVRFSDNAGTSWSALQRVNDDTLGNGKSQFLPSIAIDQTTGNLAISWMDSRNSAGNNTAENWSTLGTYVAGNLTFLPNIKTSAGVSNANTAGNGLDYGDYLGICFHANTYYPIWSDNSGAATLPGYVGSPAFDVATAKVTVSITNPAAPGSPTASPNRICIGQTSTLSATPGVGNTVDWFTGGCGVTAVPGGATPVVSPGVTTTYYARGRNIANGCTGASCSTVIVTIANNTGDFDGGGVHDSDLPTFVSILLNPGTPQDCVADMNNDGSVDGRDIPQWVAAYMIP